MSELAWHVSPDIEDRTRHFPPDLKRQVRKAMDEISWLPETGKPLTEDLAGCRSYRIGKYRLIYRIEAKKLGMVTIGPRRDVYKKIALEIARQKIRERSARYGAKPRKR